MNGTALKVVDLFTPTFNNHPSTTFDMDSVHHMTSDIRHSPVSYAMLKSWEWPGDEASYDKIVILLY